MALCYISTSPHFRCYLAWSAKHGTRKSLITFPIRSTEPHEIRPCQYGCCLVTSSTPKNEIALCPIKDKYHSCRLIIFITVSHQL